MQVYSVVTDMEVRPIVLMMAKALAVEGKTLIITDDASYRRVGLKVNNFISRLGFIDIAMDHRIYDSEGNVRATSFEEVAAKVSEVTNESYKTCIVVNSDYFVEDAACKIYFKGKNSKLLNLYAESEIRRLQDIREAAEEAGEKAELDESKGIKEIYVSGYVDKKGDKEKQVIVLTANALAYVFGVEEEKQMGDLKDKNFLSSLCSVMADKIGMDSSRMMGLVTRKETIEQGDKKK